MNCQRADELFIEYLYGELTPQQAESVRTHLEECADCTARLAELAQVRELTARVPDPEPSRMVVNRVLARAREDAERSLPIWGLRWLKIVAPACVMVALGGLVLYQMRNGMVSKDLSVSPSREEYQVVGSDQPLKKEKEVSVARAPLPEKEIASAPAQIPPAEHVLGQKEEPSVVSGARPSVPQDIELGDKTSSARTRVSLEKRPERFAAPMRERAEPSAVERDSSQRGPRPTPGAQGLISAKEPSPSVSATLDEAEKALEAGKYEQAKEAFSRVLVGLAAGHPDRPRALLGQARALEGLGELDMARRAYQALADESPDHRDLARRRIKALAGP